MLSDQGEPVLGVWCPSETEDMSNQPKLHTEFAFWLKGVILRNCSKSYTWGFCGVTFPGDMLTAACSSQQTAKNPVQLRQLGEAAHLVGMLRGA